MSAQDNPVPETQAAAPPAPAAPGPEAPVSLREITEDTLREICKLSDTLSPAQQRMVAPNAYSIAEAYFQPHHWFRAIYAGETPVGFIMLYTGPDDFINKTGEDIQFLWRFMIAGPYQRLGCGRRALGQVIDDLRARGVREFYTSCEQGEATPEPFYARLGFQRTGQVLEEEVVLRLEL